MLKLPEQEISGVLLNGPTTECLLVHAGVLESSILGQSSLLIYVDDLFNDIVSTVKFFADDTSLFFSILQDSNISANEVNDHLQKISEWACKWKISIHPDLNQQA